MTPRSPPQPLDHVNPVLTSEGWPAPPPKKPSKVFQRLGCSVRPACTRLYLESTYLLTDNRGPDKAKREKKKDTLSEEEIFGCRIWIQCFLTSLDMPLGGMGAFM